MGPLVAKAPEAAQAAMEHQFVEAWTPHVVDGTIRGDQPMALAMGKRR